MDTTRDEVSRQRTATGTASIATLDPVAKQVVEAGQRLWDLAQQLGRFVHAEPQADPDATFDDLLAKIRDAGPELQRASRRLHELGGRIVQREPLTIAIAGLRREEVRFYWLARGPAHVSFVPDTRA